MLDALGIHSLWGPLQSMHPSFVIFNPHVTTTSLPKWMFDRRVVVLPMLEYVGFRWRETLTFCIHIQKTWICLYPHIYVNDYISFEHVHVVDLKGKEVDMPYGLWEDLHQILVGTWKIVTFRLDYPELRCFYKTMEEQLRYVIGSSAIVTLNKPHVPFNHIS